MAQDLGEMLKKHGVLREGHFLLTSGKHSDKYFEKFRILEQPPVCEAFAKQRVDTTDGVKVYFDGGWTLIRPSGTEPIFRIYSEGRTDQKAHEIADRCEKVVREILGSLSS